MLRRSELWLARELPQRLDDSRIAEALADGGGRLALIYEYTPPGLRQIVLGSQPQGLMDSLRLLARNLDWYVSPPRRHLRLIWLALPLLTLVLAVLLLLQPLGLLLSYSAPLAVFGLSLFSLVDSLVVVERRRYSESIRYLMRHMQQRFYAHGE